MRCIPLVVVAVSLGSVTLVGNTDTRASKAETPAVDKAVNLCSTCHGPRGISTSPEFPILAGQGEAYLIGQMKAFRDSSRGDKEAHQYMWGIAAQLDDAAIEGIARYYSKQPPPPARPVNEALAIQVASCSMKAYPSAAYRLVRRATARTRKATQRGRGSPGNTPSM